MFQTSSDQMILQNEVYRNKLILCDLDYTNRLRCLFLYMCVYRKIPIIRIVLFSFFRLSAHFGAPKGTTVDSYLSKVSRTRVYSLVNWPKVGVWPKSDQLAEGPVGQTSVCLPVGRRPSWPDISVFTSWPKVQWARHQCVYQLPERGHLTEIGLLAQEVPSWPSVQWADCPVGRLSSWPSV